jgi:LysR family nitrogen assimilation transcriptional regulator
VELSQLRCFVFAAEQRSVSRAAMLLEISQPTLSRRVRELEAELRTSLFRRHGHGVELTPSGHRFFSYSKEVLLVAEAALVAMRQEVYSFEGSFSIGLPPSLGELAIPRIAATLQKIFPKAVFSFVEGGSGGLYDQVLSNRIDCAAVRNPTISSQIKTEQLRVEALYLVGACPIGPPGHAIGLSELSRVPLIMPTLVDSKRTLLDPAFSLGEFTPNVVMEVDSVSSTLKLAQAGVGYAVIPETTIAVLPRTGPDLSCQRIEAPGVLATLCFIQSNKLGAMSLQAKAARACRDEIVRVLIEAGFASQ